MIDDVEVRDAGRKGKGVFALRDFRTGEFIFRRRNAPAIRGADIPTLSAEDRMHLTELGWDRYAVVLPPGAYLNHACDPTAMRSGVKVFAWTDIAAGDEVTIDYRLNAFLPGDCGAGTGRASDDLRSSESAGWECLCATTSCTGWVVGSYFEMDDDRQRAYLPYAPDFITREYRRRQRGAR